MNNFQNPFINNMNYMDAPNDTNKGCGCNNEPVLPKCGGCKNVPMCPTIYQDCPPIVTCSKQVIDQYHVVRQPYVHNYHTEVVHHHIVQNEFIPNYTCSEVHVNEPNNSDYPRR